jgi:replicative DNA helicase
MERALLGALMLNQNAMYEVADLIVDSFYAGKHRTIFDAMLSLYAKGEPIDLVTVSGKLKERKLLGEVGGAGYLSELVGAAASPGSARHYAQNVQTKFVLRSLIDAAAKIGELGFEEDRDVEIILDEAQSAVPLAPSRTSWPRLGKDSRCYKSKRARCAAFPPAFLSWTASWPVCKNQTW